MIRTIKPKTSVNGVVEIPGDKSISHRAIMLSAIAEGDSHITHFLMGEDCLHTISIFRELGVDIDVNDSEIVVHGKGLHSLCEPRHILDAGNSGTTARLLFGLLSAQQFDSILDGDGSLRLRPMARVIDPLREMGARCLADHDKYLPANIFGTKLHGIDYTMPVASAQVKSSIILASLYADGESRIVESKATRNHTELMLASMGGDIERVGDEIRVRGGRELVARDIFVDGDISSASYFIVAGCLLRDSELTLRNVNINDTRAGILKVLDRMGANISVENIRTDVEKVADIVVRSSDLRSTTIEGGEIPTLIDELPIIAIAAMLAEGDTVVRDAGELKVKETNRIDTICDMVTALGGDIEATSDGFIVRGVESIEGGFVNPLGDHRIAMAGAIGAILARDESRIMDAECIDISFPDFFDILEKL